VNLVSRSRISQGVLADAPFRSEIGGVRSAGLTSLFLWFVEAVD
jgi:hypothetical protein